MLFPWKMLCITHPVGHHQTHRHGELSPCELRKAYSLDLPAVFPPMHCQRVLVQTDVYPQVDALSLTVIDELYLPHFEKDISPVSENLTFIDKPFPRCRSATVYGFHFHRGPPSDFI